MALDNRTERATPRRRQRARERGQIVRSRELSSAVSLLAAVCVTAWQPLLAWPNQWRTLLAYLLDRARSGDVHNVTPLVRVTFALLWRWTLPVIVSAWALSALTSLIQARFLFAVKALTPSLGRFNPVNNLRRLFSIVGLSNILKSLVPMSFIIYLAVALLGRDWAQMARASYASPGEATIWLLERLFELAWKSALIFLAWSLVDYALQKRSYEQQLRMTKEEVREDLKTTEANPQVKRRIRRAQLQMRRRFTLKRVERATVVITNPTHYAVALEYRMESMPAPVVVAKGQNLLARQIRRTALWHEVPIVESPALAQALYRAVDVGQAIPAKLYAAVAEILAFIFRAQQRVLGPYVSQRA